MAESSTSSEQSENSEVISPVAPREQMINTAVSFLQNPRVKTSTMSQRRAFLNKKGLTDEEIDIAIQRSGITSSAVVPHGAQSLVPVNTAGSMKVYHPSVWTRMYRVSSAFIVMGVAVYGLHQFYKLYIEPWLYGQGKDTLTELKDQLLDVQLSLCDLQKSVSAMERSVHNQKTESDINIKDLDPEQMFNPLAFMEMRSDIATIKSLLLNRNQFPEVPKIYASIPSWQLPLTENEQSEVATNQVKIKGQNKKERAKHSEKSCRSKKTSVNNDENGDIVNGKSNNESEVHTEKHRRQSAGSKEVSPDEALTPEATSEIASTGSDFSIISNDIRSS